jgi:hypothetical protein
MGTRRLSVQPPLPPMLELGRAWRATERLQLESARVSRAMKQAVEEFSAATRKSYADYIAQLQRALESDAVNMQAKARQIALDLASRGWYPDPDISMANMRKVVALYDNGGMSKADATFTRYYTKHNEKVEQEVVRAFPRRGKIITSAFWAHREQQFFLSVPVLLAQADGICVDELGGELFQRDRRTQKARAAQGLANAGPAEAAFLAPLAEIIPVMASHSERAALRADELFRHTVLHGESVDYGTETNSCKSISLLRYLAWLLPDLRRSQPTPP